jgi:hypothetical protein
MADTLTAPDQTPPAGLPVRPPTTEPCHSGHAAQQCGACQSLLELEERRRG